MWIAILAGVGAAALFVVLAVVLIVVLGHFDLLPWETARSKEYTWDDY